MQFELGYDINSKTQTTSADGKYYPSRHAMHFKLAGTGGVKDDQGVITEESPSIETKMSIISNGNIGIGTDNPESRLEVVGDISCSDLNVCRNEYNF